MTIPQPRCSPAYHRHHAREMMHAAEQWYRDQGYHELGSDGELANDASQRSHASPGFQPTLRLQYFRKLLLSHSIMTQRVTPQLRSTNWPRTRAFYEDGLGFRVQWEHRFEPGLPVFAEVTRDGLSLFLTEHTGDCQVGGAAYIIVDDVDALYQEVKARGIKVAEPPEQAPWGTREMSIIDPDGNRLRFAQAKPEEMTTAGGC